MLLYSLESQETELTYRATSNVVLRPHYAAVLPQTVAGTAGKGSAFPLGGRE